MSRQVLNHDILGLIYDNLANDRETLAQCSLVCQSWLFPTGAHLFHELSLRKPSFRRDDNRLEALLHIIQVSQRMRHFAHHLELHSRGKYRSFTVAQLEPIVSHLPNLQSIMLCGVHIQMPLPRSLITRSLRYLQSIMLCRTHMQIPLSLDPPLPRPLIARSLQYLEFWNNTECAALECDALTGLLDLFEHIDKLYVCMRLTNVRYSWSGLEMERQRMRAPLHVKHLELVFNRSPVLEGILDAMRRSLGLAALEIIHFQGVHPSAVPSVRQLLRCCGALRELRISLGWEYDFPERSQLPNPGDMQLDLTQCTKLSVFGMSGVVLRLEDVHDLAHARNRVGWQLLCDTMKTIPADSPLEMVDLDLKLDWRSAIEQLLDHERLTDNLERYLVQLNWGDLGMGLDRFPSLKEVKVRVIVAGGMLWKKRVWEMVRELFPPRVQRILRGYLLVAMFLLRCKGFLP